MKQNTLTSSIISGILNINVSPPKSKLEDLQFLKLLKIVEFVIAAVWKKWNARGISLWPMWWFEKDCTKEQTLWRHLFKYVCWKEGISFPLYCLFVSVFCFFFSKIIVDGVRGISYRGDAALDDFSFQKGTCNQTGIYRTQERMS